MKNLANYISILRIILSVLLLFTPPLSLLFFIVFILCGVSDFLDGYVARSCGLNSDFGANLDTIADAVFFLCFLIVLLPIVKLSYLVILWIISIVLIKIISIVIGFLKFNRLSFIHTYLNKITGLCIILLPFFLLLTSSDTILIILCILATFAALEELIMIISGKDLNLNQKSILKK